MSLVAWEWGLYWLGANLCFRFESIDVYNYLNLTHQRRLRCIQKVGFALRMFKSVIKGVVLLKMLLLKPPYPLSY
jgi:hypothetical protein